MAPGELDAVGREGQAPQLRRATCMSRRTLWLEVVGGPLLVRDPWVKRLKVLGLWWSQVSCGLVARDSRSEVQICFVTRSLSRGRDRKAGQSSA